MVARRMTPEARRAEILGIAQAVIAEEGYRGLTLRELARRCGMSAPGLMHYFPDMPTLLTAVLARRDETDMAEFWARGQTYENVLEVIDAMIVYYAERPAELSNFIRLEAEALDPRHPAHDYFLSRNNQSFDELRPYVERDYDDPDAVLVVLRLIVDGLRMRLLRDPDRVDLGADWRAVRDTLPVFLARQPPAADRVTSEGRP
ncbi:TetR/AcrR family transcriptional regulator [Streptomyces albipurpureus]|uniref:TetR/AcrR family transcriptional regulator n=1 Tax=Streptomyces albipurpureus TaxID=2897419 RepID=A0ABT0UFV8_9ACTN|nr:TetR/AcrR family transcriptional regulator [Streptomyces sp. CWNU-1]MCM2387285.1 TetR/AcrR family transcriptional regulator [Streptomyces sp. CWNU-1]